MKDIPIPVNAIDPYVLRVAAAQRAIKELAKPDILHTQHVFTIFNVGTENGGNLAHNVSLFVPAREIVAAMMIEQGFRQLARQYPDVFIAAMQRIREVTPG